jgi:hypothetical protein
MPTKHYCSPQSLNRYRDPDIISVLQGLIYTAGLMHNVLHALNIPLHVQEVRLLLTTLSATNITHGTARCYPSSSQQKLSGFLDDNSFCNISLLANGLYSHVQVINITKQAKTPLLLHILLPPSKTPSHHQARKHDTEPSLGPVEGSMLNLPPDSSGGARLLIGGRSKP